MSREDVITHLGTIAKSGTADFMKNLSGDQKKDSQLIGQFGVGFYSAFIVADQVEVFTRRAGLAASEGVHWSSKGEGEFEVATVDKAERGTRIVLHLKSGEDEFADGWRLRNIIKKYSDHIALPIELPKEAGAGEGQTPSRTSGKRSTAPARCGPVRAPRSRTRNTRSSTSTSPTTSRTRWPGATTRSKASSNTPRCCMCRPARRSTCTSAKRRKGLKLYVQRVFIMDQAEQFLPLYLRFIKGVVDSNDLSLNVSREILQKDPMIDSMKSALTKRVLDMLEKLAKNEPEQYKGFWKDFGQVLKEGPAEDFANKEKIAGLLRFASTIDDSRRAERLVWPTTCARMQGRSGQDLLPDRRKLRAGQEQPAPGSLPQERHRSAAADRPHRRVADELPHRIRRQGVCRRGTR